MRDHLNSGHSQGGGFALGPMGRFGVGSLLPRRIRRDMHMGQPGGSTSFGQSHQPGAPVVATLPLESAVRRCNSDPNPVGGKGPLPCEQEEEDAAAVEHERKLRDMESKFLKSKSKLQRDLSREDMVRGRLTALEDYVWDLSDKMQSLIKDVEGQGKRFREAHEESKRQAAELGQQMRSIARQEAQRQVAASFDRCQVLNSNLSQQVTSTQSAQDRLQSDVSQVLEQVDARMAASETALHAKLGKLSKEQTRSSDLRHAVEELRWEVQCVKEKGLVEIEKKADAEFKELRDEVEEVRAKVAEVDGEVSLCAERQEAHHQWTLEALRNVMKDAHKQVSEQPGTTEQVKHLTHQLQELQLTVMGSEQLLEVAELRKAVEVMQQEVRDHEATAEQKVEALWMHLSSMQVSFKRWLEDATAPPASDVATEASPIVQELTRIQERLDHITPALEEQVRYTVKSYVGELEASLRQWATPWLTEQVLGMKDDVLDKIAISMQAESPGRVHQPPPGGDIDPGLQRLHVFGDIARRLSSVEAQVKGHSATLETQKVEVSTLAQQVDAAAARPDPIPKVKQEVRERLERVLEQRLQQALEATHQHLHGRVDEELTVMKDALEDVQKQAQALAAQMEDQSSKTSAASAEHSALRTKVEKLTRAHKGLSERLEQLKTTQADMDADLEGRVGELQEKLAQLAEALAGTDQFSTLVTLAESIQASLDSKAESEVVDSLRTQLSTAHKAVKRDLQKVDRRIGEVGQSLETVSAAVSGTRDLMGQVQRMEQRIMQTETCASAAQTEMEELFGLIASVHRKYHGQANRTFPALAAALHQVGSSPETGDGGSSTQDEGQHSSDGTPEDARWRSSMSSTPESRSESLSSCARGSSLDGSLSVDDSPVTQSLSPFPTPRPTHGRDTQGEAQVSPRRSPHTPRRVQELELTKLPAPCEEGHEGVSAQSATAPTSPLTPATPCQPQSPSSLTPTTRPPRLPASPEGVSPPTPEPARGRPHPAEVVQQPACASRESPEQARREA